MATSAAERRATSAADKDSTRYGAVPLLRGPAQALQVGQGPDAAEPLPVLVLRGRWSAQQHPSKQLSLKCKGLPKLSFMLAPRWHHCDGVRILGRHSQEQPRIRDVVHVYPRRGL